MGATFEGWGNLDWKGRRERRFHRWLAATGVPFAGDSARQAYTERIQLFIDALALKKPARVPVNSVMGFYPTKFGGLSLKEAMYEFEKAGAAWTAFYEYFQPDYQSMPVPPASVFDKLGLQFIQWPGHGIGENTPWQYLEAEYMKAEDYDALIADPSDWFRSTYLPRIGSAFAPLAGLDSFVNMMEASMIWVNILPFANPAVLEAVRRLTEAAQESFRYLMTVGAANVDAGARLGIPPMAGAMGKAPYDVLADTLRGTRGIVMDRFRQPEKILAAAERLTPLMTRWILNQVTVADAPVCIFVLHKGADGFMSDADFRTFYWPTLKAVMLGLIEQGVVPLMFAEGGYNSRLEAIADDEIPAGSVIWLFDQTDMAAAKRILRGRACIAGNVPSSLLAIGTAGEVEKYVTDLLDECASDGGFVLMTGAVVDDAKPETLKALIDSGRAWRG
jgi:uroporphyrinogen-III decarboxylase